MGDSDDVEWEDIEQLIAVLKQDGYQPVNVEASTKEPAPEKSFIIDVER